MSCIKRLGVRCPGGVRIESTSLPLFTRSGIPIDNMRTPSFSLLSSALLLIGGAVAGRNGKQADDSCLDASFVALSGKPVGTEVKHGNRELP